MKHFTVAFLSLFLYGIGLSSNCTAATLEIKMVHNQFQPALITIHVGDTIVWRNEDGEDHTVTFEDGSKESGGLPHEATFSRMFQTSGKFGYDCSLHVDMHGDIVVLR